jgi:hypothetical protein
LGITKPAAVGLPDPKCGSIIAAFAIKARPDMMVESIDEFCASTAGLPPASGGSGSPFSTRCRRNEN